MFSGGIRDRCGVIECGERCCNSTLRGLGVASGHSPALWLHVLPGGSAQIAARCFGMKPSPHVADLGWDAVRPPGPGHLHFTVCHICVGSLSVDAPATAHQVASQCSPWNDSAAGEAPRQLSTQLTQCCMHVHSSPVEIMRLS